MPWRLNGPVLAWASGGLCLALVVATVFLHSVNGGTPRGELTGWWASNALIGLALAVPGTVLADRRPRHPIGWLLGAGGVASAITGCGREYAVYTLGGRGHQLPGGAVALWAAGWLWEVAIGILVVVILLFPDGRLMSRRWRLLFGAAVFSVAADVLKVASAPYCG